MFDEITRQLKAHIDTVNLLGETLTGPIGDCARVLIAALQGGHKILVMGNGGSAADAQHFAAEMVGRYLLERKAIPVIALTTDTSILTSVGNDYGFDEIFARQVEALAGPGDVLIGISTSGHSRNVMRALEVGKAIGTRTIGLLGRDGGEVGPLVELALTVPGDATPRIQEAHLLIVHILCDLVEKELFQSGVSSDR
jgi:D-sedoheptulose 7-phosphate isomerase